MLPAKNFNVEMLFEKINSLFDKGVKVKMKNKDKFEKTLVDTNVILKDNKDVINQYKDDPYYSKIMHELNQTLTDLDSKLSKLALIKFCKDR